MPEFTQGGRLLRVETPLGEDVLLLAGFSGVEGVSRPFEYTLDLLSTDPAIEAKKLLGQEVTIKVRLSNGAERAIHGIVNRFVQLGRGDDLTSYQAVVVPWLWFLSLSYNCRIFQNMTVPEIIQAVFKEHGYRDFEIKCTASYLKREYCVQYRESDLNFISRLMEEEGIFYFFRHSGSRHDLVLADGKTAIHPCPEISVAAVSEQPRVTEDTVLSLRQEHAVHVGAVALSDYDYLQPSLKLSSSVSGTGVGEVYDYHPGRYRSPDEGDRIARIRLEAEEAMQHVVRGFGNCRFLEAGHRFDLVEHYREDVNRAYTLLEVRVSGRNEDYLGRDGLPAEFRSEFLAIPYEVPYRPPLRTPKPMIRGTQTALVVGKSGEELWVDKHGRVKIQFYWDRLGKKDENSSCWVRVATPWAGKGWGAIHIPRIGQEVVVQFLEGDPDQPIIVGSVYNAEQVPPYALPDNQTQSGIKSRSTKGGGTADYNEIRMEDKKGAELLYFHAQKDMQVVVENDRRETVGRDETITVKRNRTETVEEDESIEIKGNRTEKVEKDESITIMGQRTEEVGEDESVRIKGSRETKVDRNDRLDVGQRFEVTAAELVKFQVSRGKLEAEALQSIELKVGANSIKIDQSGITIKGTLVTVEGTGKADLKSPMTMVEGTGMVTVKGPMANLNGSGMVKIQGALTMIN